MINRPVVTYVLLMLLAFTAAAYTGYLTYLFKVTRDWRTFLDCGGFAGQILGGAATLWLTICAALTTPDPRRSCSVPRPYPMIRWT